jgi:bifunctional non-homologous end joining protein LigD
LICLAPDGRVDFYEVMSRHGLHDACRNRRAARTTPATFMGFGVIEAGARRVTGQSLTERNAILADLVRPAGAVQLVESFTGAEGQPLLRAVASRDVEGIVRKRLASMYRLDHRSTDWVKVKAWRTSEVAVLGIRWAPEFGVLVGAPGQAPLCAVELGMTPTDRAALARLVPELTPRRQGDVT